MEKTTVVVGNLEFDVTEEKILEVFRRYGTVHNVQKINETFYLEVKSYKDAKTMKDALANKALQNRPMNVMYVEEDGLTKENLNKPTKQELDAELDEYFNTLDAKPKISAFKDKNLEKNYGIKFVDI